MMINITDLPDEILQLIFTSLDDHSIVMVGWTNKKFRQLLFEYVLLQKALWKVKKFVIHRKVTMNKINKIFRRNLCCEFGYVIYGECEQCYKLGFLREICSVYQNNNSKCICIENCPTYTLKKLTRP